MVGQIARRNSSILQRNEEENKHQTQKREHTYPRKEEREMSVNTCAPTYVRTNKTNIHEAQTSPGPLIKTEGNLVS